MNNDQFLFVQDISRLAPEGYSYGENDEQDLQMARQAFIDRGVDVTQLDIYSFDVYRPGRDELIVAFIAGEKINKIERGAWVEVSIRDIAEENSNDLYGEDLARLINRINNHLVANGATVAGKSTEEDDIHWEVVQEEELEEPTVLDEQTSYYGVVFNITDWGK